MSWIPQQMIAAAILVSSPAMAQYSDGVIKIGVLVDMAGPYSNHSGPGSVIAARLAVADFGASAKGMKVEVVSADHQNRPDVASSIAGAWFDVEKVDVILNGTSSGVGLVINEIARQRNKVYLATGPATSDLTGSKCSANTVQWTRDTWTLAHSTGKAMVESGGDTWFFITADYAFGQALERDTASVVEANRGRVLGRLRHPLNANDFSSYLLSAQSSKAKVIGLANAGDDTINAVKQAAEFGIVKGGQSLAGLLVLSADVAALGLSVAQGLVLTEDWYWDLNEPSRAWTKRWQAERSGRLPTAVQAGDYSAVTHYLKAIESIKSDTDGKAVVARMKEISTDDPLYGRGMVRADGRLIKDVYMFEVKKPEDSKYPGDFYKLRATIPAAEAYRPLKEGGCPLING
jgi:branched-chain amino acid transport system substrate-binding protein